MPNQKSRNYESNKGIVGTHVSFLNPAPQRKDNSELINRETWGSM
jgi:hypothetical protein